MKNTKRIISVALGCVFSASLLFSTACKSNESSSDDSVSQEPEIVFTDYALVENRTSDYVLLLPAEATPTEKICAAEINLFFSEATGVILPIVNEGTTEAASAQQFISIGETQKASAQSVNVNYNKLGVCGYVVKTLEDDVYIFGDDPGIVYGGYEFLRQQFDYQYYADSIYKINKNVSNVKLADFDVKDIPDIEYRQTGYGFEKYAANDSMYKYRMRLNDMQPAGAGVNGSWHNFFNAIPPEKHMAEHSNWYSDDGNQLCLTRDRDGLAAEMKNVIVDMLEEDPTLKYIHIGQQDVRSWCECSKCVETISKYGGYRSSTLILFVNKVSELLEPYLTEKKLDVKLSMFAYHKTTDAPVVEDTENGGYKLISNDLKLRPNINVLYAPIDADYYTSIDDPDSDNAIYMKNLQGWDMIANQLLMWIYTENFKHYLQPFDNFASIQRNLQLAKEADVFWLYNQAQWNNYNATGFSKLKAYITARLMWDVDSDIDFLIQDFFDGYFGEASSTMMEVFEDFRTWRAHCYYELGWEGDCSAAPKEKYWPYQKVKYWLDKIDEAYTKIEQYKTTNSEKYNVLYDTICLESIAFRYQMITYNYSYFSDTQLLEMKRSFKQDATRLNITKLNEKENITDLYTSWGVA